MNHRSTLTLLATLCLGGALCAAVPQIVDRDQAPLATSPATTTQPVQLDPDPLVPATQPLHAPDTQSAAVHMREQAEQTRGTTAYIALFVVLLVTGFGVPIPEEIPLMLAGYLARHGAASLYGLIPIGLAGVLLADFILFMAVRRWRNHIFRFRWIRATIRPPHLVFVRDQFHKHGMKIVIVARWVPALRTAVCVTAGLTGVSKLHFLLVDATAACITVPTGIFLGYFAANQIDRIIALFVRAEHTALLIVLLAAAALAIYWLLWGRHRHRRKKLARRAAALRKQAWHPDDLATAARSDKSD